MKSVFTFQFSKEIENKFIEQELIESILTTEDVFGKPKVELNATYLVSENKAVIDVSDEIGKHIFSVFTGRLDRKIGRNRYSFQRVPSNI